MSPLWHKPAHELAAMIRARQLSSLELTRALIERIEAVNPPINALVVPSFELALQQARNWDAAPRAGAALGGVPFTVKESLNVAGLPSTLGSLQRRHRLALATATSVKRLLGAGGVLLGLSNLPERGFGSETYNLIYGRTRNPHDLSRTPGGSSGGEAALIAGGGSPLGLGSDLDGSIRMPAFYCGIYGHKPSQGLIPVTGHFPYERRAGDAPERESPVYLTVGPLARASADLALALEIISGPDGLDASCTLRLPPAPEAFCWRGRRVYLMPRPRIKLATAVQPAIARGVIQAAKALQALGAELEELPADLFVDALEIWGAAMADDTPRQTLPEGPQGLALLTESLKLFNGTSRHTPPALLYAWANLARGLRGRRLRQLLAEAARLRGLLERRLGDAHLLLLPPQPTTAPRHDELLGRPFDFGYTALFNVLGLPATAIPLGLDPDGLPYGVQAIAAHGQDRLCLQAAASLEQTCGGWTHPISL